VEYFFQINCANPENRIMVIADLNFLGNLNVLIYTLFEVGGGAGVIFGFRARSVQKESDVK